MTWLGLGLGLGLGLTITLTPTLTLTLTIHVIVTELVSAPAMKRVIRLPGWGEGQG